MAYLEVPGAELCYQAIGKGPMLLCISGANGSYDRCQKFAESLQDRFTVVSYDRRGFSRSYLNGAQDYAHRLETDTDDAAALIRHISPNEPATVVGNSSGAIVALKLLARHPDIIRTLISHEPPAAGLLPESDYENIKTSLHNAYDAYRQHGPMSGLEKLCEVIKVDIKIFAMSFNPRAGPYIWANTQYWFEREFLPYPLVTWDVDKEFRPSKEKLVLANGELSNKEPMQYRANVELGEKLGIKIVHLPGEHVGHISHPVEFGQELVEVLKAKDSYYA